MTLVHNSELYAQETPSENNVEKAKEFFTKGSTEYKLGNFEIALEHFKTAFRYANRPSILFNIAQSCRMLNRRREAMFYYNLYLTEWEKHNPKKPPPNQEEVLLHVDQLKQEIAEEDAQAKAVTAIEPESQPASKPVEQTPKIKLALPTTMPTTNSVEDNAIAASMSRTSHSAEPAARPFYKTWWFWTAVGATVAASVATVAVVSATSGFEPTLGSLGAVELR